MRANREERIANRTGPDGRRDARGYNDSVTVRRRPYREFPMAAAAENLTAAKCKPCEGGVDPLTPDEARELLAKVDGWELTEEAKVIGKSVTRADFMDAVAFVVRVAGLAEAEGHHPNIHLTDYRELRIELSTHAIGGLSENDFIVAAKIDALES